MNETLYTDELASTTILNPPTLWLGGVPLRATELPQDISAEVFNSLNGCIYNVSYTHTSSVSASVLTAEDSVANM